MLATLALLSLLTTNPIRDPNTFPIAVWLQSPANATAFKAAGFNLYVGLWQGPTEDQLAQLTMAGMPVVCEQNEVGLKHKSDPIIVGWMHGDEPDNAQPVRDPATGGQTWGPCIPPQRIVEDYGRLKKLDPTRPVLLNLGQGVANDAWIGRGTGAKLSDYETYVKGGDIISFDVYPVAGLGDAKQLGLLAKGIDRLRGWSGGSKRIWNCLECTAIDGKLRPSPAQVRAEAWSAIIHGSTGLIYFVHQFAPKFDEHALLDDAEMLSAVKALNAEIQKLAPVLLSLSIGGVSASSSNIHVCAKTIKGQHYTFAISTSSRPVEATLRPNMAKGAASVGVGDNSVSLTGGTIQLRFEPYELKVLQS